jgi:hypothetical protein
MGRMDLSTPPTLSSLPCQKVSVYELSICVSPSSGYKMSRVRSAMPLIISCTPTLMNNICNILGAESSERHHGPEHLLLVLLS